MCDPGYRQANDEDSAETLVSDTSVIVTDRGRESFGVAR